MFRRQDPIFIKKIEPLKRFIKQVTAYTIPTARDTCTALLIHMAKAFMGIPNATYVGSTLLEELRRNGAGTTGPSN